MNKPLHGIRALELTHVWSGPLCGQILSDLGAEVIRVESRERLDIHRRGGPYPQGKAGLNRSGTWNAQNRGKRGCTLDLKSAEGKQLFLTLVGKSDAVIENFTPGTLERLGFGFETLCGANPRIVLLSLSGFGQTGPHRDSLAYGPMMDAATGLSSATTYADGIPRAVNGWAADVGGALYGCAALLRTLMQQPRKPRHLDISQFEAGVLFLTDALLEQANRSDPRASRARVALRATACTADAEGWIAVAACTLPEVEALGDLVGGQEATLRIVRSLAARGTRVAQQQLEQALQAWAGIRSREQALQDLKRAGVPAAPVASVEELLSDGRLDVLGAWLEIDHAETGRTRCYGPAIRLDRKSPEARPAPLLGGDNEYVFGSILGLSPAQIRDLTERRVV